MAMEAGKGAANESGVGKKSIAHRDFAAICCYLQVSGLGGGVERQDGLRKTLLRCCAPQDGRARQTLNH